MIAVEIPGTQPLRLEHLVLDYNGTLAIDGKLIPHVADRLHALATNLAIHVVTGDTFGHAREALDRLPCSLAVLPPKRQAHAKLDYVEHLGLQTTVAIGNGANDRLMLHACGLGIAVVQREGAAGQIITVADVVVPSVLDALDLLLHPLRLVATLRT